MMDEPSVKLPIGGLGERDQRFSVDIRNALEEVDQAERFSDAHP